MVWINQIKDQRSKITDVLPSPWLRPLPSSLLDFSGSFVAQSVAHHDLAEEWAHRAGNETEEREEEGEHDLSRRIVKGEGCT